MNMKRIILLFFLIFCIMVLASCEVDPSGFAVSSDVDDRFDESTALPDKSNVSIGGTDFSFIVISDTHALHGTHAKLVELKDKLLPGDQFILICGDVSACGYEEDYNAFYNALNHSGLPFYPTIGNHDLYFGGWRYYKNILGKPCYTFTAGPARIIALDSANGTLGGKQKTWLEQTLQSKTEPLCFAFTHFEFFNPGFTDMEEVYYLMNLFEKNHVQYVFMGHTHWFYHKVVNGVNYINVPSFEDGQGEKYYIRMFVNGTNISYQKLAL
jgi:predicted phosphodiesterase